MFQFKRKGLDMGLIITVGITKKGGTGKTTVLTNLVVDLFRSNTAMKLKVFDTDLENTASLDFFSDRDKHGNGFISCETIEGVNDLSKIVEFANRDSKNVAFIDVAGLDSDITASAVAIADLLFIPFRMSSKDLKALGSFIESINEAKENGATMDSYLVPNFLYANSSAGKIKKQLTPLIESGFNYGTALKNRNSYIDSADFGQSVTEYGDIKAGSEIRPLVEIILKRLENEK